MAHLAFLNHPWVAVVHRLARAERLRASEWPNDECEWRASDVESWCQPEHDARPRRKKPTSKGSFSDTGALEEKRKLRRGSAGRKPAARRRAIILGRVGAGRCRGGFRLWGSAKSRTAEPGK